MVCLVTVVHADPASAVADLTSTVISGSERLISGLADPVPSAEVIPPLLLFAVHSVEGPPHQPLPAHHARLTFTTEIFTSATAQIEYKKPASTVSSGNMLREGPLITMDKLRIMM
jgi:hypothetical protein